MKKSYEIDMCNGPILGKLLMFALPLMLSSILQLLFNAADVVVVGKFSGSHALAAVGSTGALINLFVNIFMGFSVGTNVLVAQYFGARDEKNVQETVHTSMLLGVLGGFFLILIGIPLAKPILSLMSTPENVLHHAALYMRIYFLGMPAMLVYNFGAAILRAVGDTRRPLYYLLGAGVVNVILNLILVIVFHMGVAGVAIATVTSQVISACLIVRCLMHSDGQYRLELRKLHIYEQKFFGIVRIGLPAGLQGALFSISNVLIQSSINSFGATAMAGATAAGNLEGFVFMSMNSIHQAAVSFSSQNVGGGKQERLPRITVLCLTVVFVIGLIMGNGACFFGEKLLSLYSSDPEVILAGMERMRVICRIYFLCGIMDVTVGILRGMGYSIVPMLISLTGVCGLRVVWIFGIFARYRSLFVLYFSYPVTWIITLTVQLVCLIVIWKRKKGHWASIGNFNREVA